MFLVGWWVGWSRPPDQGSWELCERECWQSVKANNAYLISVQLSTHLQKQHNYVIYTGADAILRAMHLYYSA